MPCSTRTSSPEAPLPLGPANLSEVPKAVGAAPESASSAPLPLPACQASSPLDDPSGLLACGPAEVPESELPACADIIYRPWFSPYSYLISTKEATQQLPSSLSSSSAAATAATPQEQEELDDLSETACSPSSSDKAQPPEGERLAGSRSSITIQDILSASQQQPLPQQGYKCMACCRVFPMLWSVQSHIQNSAQEGYSCRVYYRRLKALWEKEQREQELQPARGHGRSPAGERRPREGAAPSLLPAPQ
ncbi:LOW QUALITY PROTEIN: spermatogenesis-associated protein 46 [Melanerpes formicivorus]|uniref:LOW QUALITY PROTEIN: spermatogenesis-associated protein 46 n=1 Tax=Melanerpes formicivorus TaxID=211600 RepID=UPI00358F4310